MAKTPSNDRATVEKTLRFLGRQLMTQQFILRGVVKKRNSVQKQEDQTRKLIDGLSKRMMREFDIHSDLLNGGADKPENDSDEQ